ncbi:Surfactin synthase thioesterase subunit [Actinosynnema pretiosum]|nr:Surfactin synthase thioesterase subunit [Actinosynnema pretiosum]
MFCFPHSGGSAGEFLGWSGNLPDVEVWAVQPPARGGRLDEPGITGMGEFVESLVDAVDFGADSPDRGAPGRGVGGVPFAFFGHSLGAYTAFETARALRDRGLPGPFGVWVSALRAPHLHEREPDLSALPDDELVAAVEREHGPLPPEFAEEPELLELLLPALRADLALLSGYRASGEPLDVPVEVFGGRDDGEPLAALEAWRLHTTGSCRTYLFNGGHFYFRERTDEFFPVLAESVRERAAGRLPGFGPLGPAR